MSVSSKSSLSGPEFVVELFRALREKETIAALIREASLHDPEHGITAFGGMLRQYSEDLKWRATSPIERRVSKLVRNLKGADLNDHRRAEETEWWLAEFGETHGISVMPRLSQVKDFLFGGQPFSSLIKGMGDEISRLGSTKRSTTESDDPAVVSTLREPERLNRAGSNTTNSLRSDDDKLEVDFKAVPAAKVPLLVFCRIIHLALLVIRLTRRRQLVKDFQLSELETLIQDEQPGSSSATIDTAKHQTDSQGQSPEDDQLKFCLVDNCNCSDSSVDENTALLKK
ncbi:MAG: hypothetical protein MMC33_007828 [Icmadophila ericetorum]|nr:hypothetical protein [Icmadophila ericetorum]